MTEIIQFLLQHGYLVLFVAVLLEQVGAPVPSAPVLLAAGALAAHHYLDYGVVVLLSVAGALAGDLIWYELGRIRGRKVLQFICRISLEPDSCVRSTENTFARHGSRALLIAKFIPALGIAAPPMAGMLRMSRARFLAYDAAGSTLWVLVFTGIGMVFSENIEAAALLLARLGVWALVITLGPLAGYVIWKYLQRRRFLSRLQIARIDPDEVMRKMKAGENLSIIDLRHKIDLRADDAGLPGAIHFEPEEMEQRYHEIPRDRDVVLYCT
jgi:membrane protein DedA with SNARE-associated domain